MGQISSLESAESSGPMNGEMRESVYRIVKTVASPLLFFAVAVAVLAAIIIFLAWKADSLLERRAAVDNPKSPEFIVNACTSTDLAASEYCEGYLDGAMFIWKQWAACKALDNDERSFCVGAEDADNRISAFFASCDDCNFDSFRPDLTDDDERASKFLQRLQKLPAEMESALGACPRDKQRNERYCAGYDARAANEVAELLVTYPGEMTKDVGTLGRGDGARDAGAHLFASQEFFKVQTCVTSRTEPPQARESLLNFLRENPGQKQSETAVIVLGGALHYTLCLGTEGARPHMEACVVWTRKDGEFVAENVCDAALVIQFMAKSRPSVVVREVAAGEVFRTGLSHSKVNSGWWIFTACPVGYNISVPFEANSAEIKASRYECLKK